MNMFSLKLRDKLISASSKAYDFLEVYNEEPIIIRQVHEDGVSSILLKEIAKLKNDDFFVQIRSLEINEKKTGLDFDLWIGENSNSFIRFNVQAKCFGNQCDAEGKYKIDEDQCGKIIITSKGEHKAFPMYFLYQHIEADNLKDKYFGFIDDFKNEYSGITLTSAYNIKKLCINNELKFSDIHQNDLEGRWNDDIYELFEKNDNKIGLPLYSISDISPSKIANFHRLTSNKNNSVGFFFFFFYSDDEFSIEPHKITPSEIVRLYGQNDPNSEVQTKNLVIIDDNHKLHRERRRKIRKILNE